MTAFNLPASRTEYTKLFEKLQNYDEESSSAIAAEWGKYDLFFFIFFILGRKDLDTDWHFARIREIQAQPDETLDLWFRGAGKTSIITVGMTIWNIIQNSNRTFGILSYTNTAALDFLSAIKTIFETNELLKKFYPEVCYSNPENQSPRWTIEKGITVKRSVNPPEATVETLGVDSPPTRKHYDYLIIDDVVTPQNTTTGETIKKTTENLRMCFNLLNTTGKKRFIGTRYHSLDTYSVLIENKIVTPRIFPVTLDGKPDGTPVSIRTQEWVDAKRKEMSPYIFSTQMLQNPIAEDSQRFDQELFQYYSPEDLDKNKINVYIIVDPADSEQKRADYTAIAVIGVDSLENYYLMDLVKDKLPLEKRKDALFRLVNKWRPITVGYEKYGLQSDIAYLRERQGRENVRFPIVELGGGLSKLARVDCFVPVFNNRKFFIPERLLYRDILGETHNLTEELKTEMINFPRGHDDCIDAISRVKDMNLGVQIPFGEFNNNSNDEYADFKFEL